MALSVTNQASPLGTKMVEETAIGTTALQNVTGAAGKLYMLDVDNSANGVPVWLKLSDGLSATAGTTQPDWQFKVPSGKRVVMACPDGQDFAGLCCWCTTGAAVANVGAPGSAVKMRLVTS